MAFSRLSRGRIISFPHRQQPSAPERAINSKLKALWPWVVASAAIHGLVIASLWPDPPQYLADAQYADMMVEILSAEPEQPVSMHHMKATIAPDKPRPHPVASSAVKKRAPSSVHTHTSTPILPSPRVANTQMVKTSRPAQTVASASSVPAASDPAISRQVQRKDHKGSRNAVRKHLEAFKYYPASARRRGIEGDVDVSFMLVHGGVVEQVKVLKGSGFSVLDRAALTTVARAQPFPVENGQFRFHLRFRRL